MSEMEHSNTEGAQELGEGQSDARDYTDAPAWVERSGDPDYKGDRTKRLSRTGFVEVLRRLTAKTYNPALPDGKEVHQRKTMEDMSVPVMKRRWRKSMPSNVAAVGWAM